MQHRLHLRARKLGDQKQREIRAAFHLRNELDETAGRAELPKRLVTGTLVGKQRQRQRLPGLEHLADNRLAGLKAVQKAHQSQSVRLLRNGNHRSEVHRTGHGLGIKDRAQSFRRFRGTRQDFLEVAGHGTAGRVRQRVIREVEEQPEGILDGAFQAQALLHLLGRAVFQKQTVLPIGQPAGHVLRRAGDRLDGVQRDDGLGD